jgi:hypothetical protein
MFGIGLYLIILLVTNFFTFVMFCSTENIKKIIDDNDKNIIVNHVNGDTNGDTNGDDNSNSEVNEKNKTKTIIQKLLNRLNKKKMIINELKIQLTDKYIEKMTNQKHSTNEYLHDENIKLTTTELNNDQLSEMKVRLTNEINTLNECNNQIKNNVDKIKNMIFLIYKLMNNIAYIENEKISYYPEYKVYFECFGFPENINDIMNIDHTQLDMIKHEIDMKIDMMNEKKN